MVHLVPRVHSGISEYRKGDRWSRSRRIGGLTPSLSPKRMVLSHRTTSPFRPWVGMSAKIIVMKEMRQIGIAQILTFPEVDYLETHNFPLFVDGCH